MGFNDLVEQQVAQYRKSILFNIQQGEPTSNIGLVEVLRELLMTYYHLKPEVVALTPKPDKSIMSSYEKDDHKIGANSEADYKKAATKWTLTNLKTLEDQFGKLLYHQKSMFKVLAAIMGGYREAILFQLQHFRDPEVTALFMEIMNVLLPDRMRVELKGKPVNDGSKFTDHHEDEMRDWIIASISQIEVQVAKYVEQIKFVSSMG